MLGGDFVKKADIVDKRIFKKSPEELQLYLHFKKRGFKLSNKKGKGSYERRPKHVTRGNYE